MFSRVSAFGVDLYVRIFYPNVAICSIHNFNGYNDLFTVTKLHIKIASICRDCKKIVPHTSCFKQILSSDAKCTTLMKVYLKEICEKSFKLY